MSIQVTKALLSGIMSQRVKLEDVEGATGWIKLDAFCIYTTKTGVHIDFRAGGDIMATLDHPANLMQGGTLTLAADTGFEMRLQIDFKE